MVALLKEKQGMGGMDMEMPEPVGDETRTDFMGRCVPHMLNCDICDTQEFATAQCDLLWTYKQPTAGADAVGPTARKDARPLMNRAFSVLTIKNLNAEERVIEGIASTPALDRQGDIVQPMGAKFKTPMPLLWQHRHDQPVGHVEFAQPTKEGIPFKARLANISEPGELKNLVDKAWQSVKYKLVQAVSIGFMIDKYEVMKSGGYDIKEWSWLELSLVTIPAQEQATIHTIRSLDDKLLAASGQPQPASEPVIDAGVTARKATPVVKAKEAKRIMATKKPLSEQITAFENTRAAKAARMEEIMDKSAEDNETLDDAQTEEYDGLVTDLKAIDDHLVRLRALEASNRSKAIEVKASDPQEATKSRNGSGVQATVRARQVEPGIGFTRYVVALCRAKGNIMAAAEIARANEQWQAETPEVADVLKTAVSAGTTTDATWAGPLVNYQILVSSFAEYLRPLTIIGRIPGLTRVPFKVRVPRQTSAATVNWVGEGKVKPLTSVAFDSIVLDYAKIAGIIPLTDELVRASSPSAEALIRNELAAAVVQFMDSQFVDPTKASNDVSPASITNGVTAIVPSGTTGAALISDLGRLMGTFLTNNLSMSGAVFIMTQTNAMRIGLLQNSLGQQMFPTINLNGGTLLGIPVVVSENIPSSTGSPSEGYPIILAAASEILLADDGQVTIDASREASLQMDTAPDSPPTASTILVSLWQHNMMAIKAERYINWVKRRSTAVQYITSAVYTG